MKIRESQAIDKAINLIAQFMYETGAYSVRGCFMLHKDEFIHCAKWCVHYYENAFEQKQFINALELEIENCNYDSYCENIIDDTEKYLNGEMCYIPADGFRKKIIEYKEEIKKRIDYAKSYEVRRKKETAKTNNKKLRKRIFERDKYKCVKCGSTDNLTIDHIIPVVKGGTAEDENLQTLCAKCNLSKGAK